jgi:hypothetical protein
MAAGGSAQDDLDPDSRGLAAQLEAVRRSADDGFAILRRYPEVLNMRKNGTSSPCRAVSAEVTHDGER